MSDEAKETVGVIEKIFIGVMLSSITGLAFMAYSKLDSVDRSVSAVAVQMATIAARQEADARSIRSFEEFRQRVYESGVIRKQ